MSGGARPTVSCLVANESSLVLRPSAACDDILASLVGEGDEADVQYTDGGIVGRVRRENGRLVVAWRASQFMRKKEEMVAFTGAAQLPVSPFCPLFKFVNTNGSKLVRCLLVDQGYLEVMPDSAIFDVLWTGKHIKRSQLFLFGPHQRINHFPRTYEITRKDRLFKNVTAMAAAHDNDPTCRFLPKTYVLPEEHERLRRRLTKSDDRWILKPNSSSRGRGIFIIRDLLDISAAAIERCVVCKYIDNPLLINGLKFDLRIYVAVTSFFPLRLYMYEEGLARFATEAYRDDGFKNPFIHLTNYSINKKSKKFSLLNSEASEDELHEAVGSKWTLTAFRRFLKDSQIDDIALWSRIEGIVARSILSIEGICGSAMQEWSPHREACFELFGFDVLIDDNFKPWVLEVNLSPSLSVESNLDFGVKTNMLADLFNTVGFDLFDRSVRHVSQKRPFPDDFSAQQLQEMAQETWAEKKRARGWKLLLPAKDDEFDKYYHEKRRAANPQIREILKNLELLVNDKK